MDVDPNSLADPKLVRHLLENAKKRGRADIVLKCQVRLAHLEGSKYSSQLEREFWTAVSAAEELATLRNGKTTRLSRTRQKAARVGFKQCLEDWAFYKGTTDGFDLLVEGGHPELTGEAIVVRHPDEFSEAAVTAAKTRLLDHGIELSRIELKR
jgi:hypothetical protein